MIRKCSAICSRAAKVKIANSDVYSEAYAEFVETFARVVGLPPLDRYLLHRRRRARGRERAEGGDGLEGAQKYRRGPRRTRHARFCISAARFTGAAATRMSLTNTDPRKTDLFAKFDWPRVSTPAHRFFVAGIGARSRCDRARKKSREARSATFIDEQGDRHRRHHHRADPGRRRRQSFPRRMAAERLRRICDENEMLLIFDEVQCGMGATGRNWCCEHFDVMPDLLAFGKRRRSAA